MLLLDDGVVRVQHNVYVPEVGMVAASVDKDQQNHVGQSAAPFVEETDRLTTTRWCWCETARPLVGPRAKEEAGCSASTGTTA